MKLRFSPPSPYPELGDHLMRCIALSRPITDDETQAFVIPARISLERLRIGAADEGDLHNVCAFLNVGSVLARDIGETEAFAAIQDGVLALCAVKDRGGRSYAMNAGQRETILQAVSLTDELFGCTTLLEISEAHRKVLKALPMTGKLNLMRIEV